MNTTARRIATITVAATLPFFAATGVADAQTDPLDHSIGSIPNDVATSVGEAIYPVTNSIAQPLIYVGAALFATYCASAELSNPYACA